MKLSVKSEYALLALAHLARNYNIRLVKIEEIANSNEIPRKYLEQILLSLKSGRLVKSSRGSDGGYELYKEPESITIAEVLRFIDGALAPVISVSKYFYKSTPIDKNEKLLDLMQEIRDFISNKLETMTIKDII